MLKNVSRHYSSYVRNIPHFFQVFLNNEKLPFILDLFSNNQMYLSIINVIYSVFPTNKSFFFCLNMVFSFLCNSHPSRLKIIYSQKCTFIHRPWSFLIQMTPQRTSAREQFSIMSCVKNKVTKKHSNALKLKCAPGSNSKISCQFWRKVSK